MAFGFKSGPSHIAPGDVWHIPRVLDEIPLKDRAARIEFPLPNGNSIEFYARKRMTRGDFQTVLDLLKLAEDSLVIDEAAPPADGPQVGWNGLPPQ